MNKPIAQILAEAKDFDERWDIRNRMKKQGPAFTELVGRLLDVVDEPPDAGAATRTKNWDEFWSLIAKLREVHSIATRSDTEEDYDGIRRGS